MAHSINLQIRFEIMGFVVLHINKASGNDAAMTAHIERTIDPKNADREQTYLNRRLAEYPDGVKDRMQAISRRIETAGITRKIGTNQVRALRVMLSGSPEDMARIVATGRLGEWCEDNIRWLRDTFGTENVVSADLHRDELTPHIHATVVPIVSGERRKVRERKKRDVEPERGDVPNQNDPNQQTKRTYRKKPANTVRLCADDVMTRDNLELFQDTYAEAMAKYGLQRGIRGSDARHIATPQYYRDLHVKNEDLRADIAELEGRKEDVNEKIRDMYDRRDEAKEKFLAMDEYNRKKDSEIAEKEQHLEQLRQDYEPYRAQDDLNLLLDVSPYLGETLRIAKFCKGVGLTEEAIKTLFSGKPISFTGELYSSEHDRSFDAQDAKLEIIKEPSKPGEPNRYRLSLNGQNILDWFREQFETLRQVARPYVRPVIPKNNNSRRIKR